MCARVWVLEYLWRLYLFMWFRCECVPDMLNAVSLVSMLIGMGRRLYISTQSTQNRDIIWMGWDFSYFINKLKSFFAPSTYTIRIVLVLVFRNLLNRFRCAWIIDLTYWVKCLICASLYLSYHSHSHSYSLSLHLCVDDVGRTFITLSRALHEHQCDTQKQHSLHLPKQLVQEKPNSI